MFDSKYNISVFLRNAKVSKDFGAWEFIDSSFSLGDANLDKDTIPISWILSDCMQEIRNDFNAPLFLGSYYRSPNHEFLRSRSRSGSHPRFLAVDLNAGEDRTIEDTQKLHEIVKSKEQYFYSKGIQGFGYYDWGVHLDIDDRGNLRRWGDVLETTSNDIEGEDMENQTISLFWENRIWILLFVLFGGWKFLKRLLRKK